MSDRSDELTESRDRDTDAPATDDLLEETEHLLSETGVGTGDELSESAGSSPSIADDAHPASPADLDRDGGADLEPDAADRASDGGSTRSLLSPIASGLSPLTSRLSFGRYFSPKEYLALVFVIGTGLLAGATVLPIAGRTIGMLTAAFAVGLLASKRRYLEMTAAGASVGGVAAVLNHAVLAAVGSGQRLVAVGTTVGLLATVVGYYFGRDLRDGLSTDVE